MSDIFEPETKPKAKPTPQFLRKRQIDEYQADIGALEKSLNQPKVQDKGVVKGKLHRMQKALQEQSAPELTPLMKDKVAARGKELEEKIAEGMPSSEEMRKNPPGAVGKHMRWEKMNKAKIMAVKKVRWCAPEQRADFWAALQYPFGAIHGPLRQDQFREQGASEEDPCA